MKTQSVRIAVALTLVGCSSTSQLTLMPRDSGSIYHGVANDSRDTLTITIDDRTYAGTWVKLASPARMSTPFESASYCPARPDMSAPAEASAWQAKALLQAADGAGLRCDLVRVESVGSGVCRDDTGRAYDVQIREGGL